jgi:hypothetical protein
VPLRKTVRYDSIDEVLGNREFRFFGDGFRRARHDIRDASVTFGGDGSGCIAGRASVSYPADWSRKGAVDQRPHLSTIDVLIIGMRLAEIFLARRAPASAGADEPAVLRSVRIKAGNRPVEDELTGFDVTARIAPAIPSAGAERVTSIVDCQVATLRVQCEVSHPAGPAAAPAGEAGVPLPIPPAPFGAPLKARRHELMEIDADLGQLTARAAVRTTLDPGEPAPGGRLDGHPQTASPVDCFVIGLQLGQLLLYQLDELTRADSNTLWMRDTLLTMDPSRAALPAVAPALMRLDEPRLLRKSDAEVWRAAKVAGEFQGVSLRCSVAHRLPAR